MNFKTFTMKLILSIFTVLLFQNLYSQKYIKGFSINSFQIYTGFNNISDLRDFNVNNIKKIDKESIPFTSEKLILPEIYSEDYDFLDEVPYFNYYFTASADHQIKTSPLYWSFGINSTRSARIIYRTEKHGAQSYDFMYDDSINLIGYKDSSHYISKNLDIFWNKISIENALIYRTNQEKRRTLFIGISNHLGFASTKFNYSYNNELIVTQYTDGVSEELSSDVSAYSRVYKGKPNFYFSINAVFGFDVRMSKKEERFLQKVRLFTEFRPGVCFMRIPELKETYRTYNGFFSLIGFRIKL